MGSEIWLPVALAVGGYLAGSIPFGVVVSKALGAPDPRTAGSRNIGFTNVLRVSGTKAGLLTLIGDAGKGWLVAWLAAQILHGEPAILAVALAPVMGHLFSVFLSFNGGKGVATAMGAVAGISLPIGLVMVVLWLAGVTMTRISSIGALVAFAGLPVLGAAVGMSGPFLLFSCVVSGLIVLKHRENIRRLWAGSEPRIGTR